MTIPIFESMQNIWSVLLLVLVRVSGMFFLSPIFGRRNLPNNFKIGFCLMFTLLIANTVAIPDFSQYASLAAYALLIGKELLVGLMMGFISYLFFSSIYIAGQMIDMRIGFGMVNVMDPLSNIQIPITADFYVVIATLVMLATNSHHLLIEAMAESYKYLPIGAAEFSGETPRQLVGLFSAVFAIGFKIAAPVTITILITDLALGIISKSMPQMNVFMLGMPLKVILGIAIIYLTLGAFNGIVSLITDKTYKEIFNFLINVGQSQ